MNNKRGKPSETSLNGARLIQSKEKKKKGNQDSSLLSDQIKDLIRPPKPVGNKGNQKRSSDKRSSNKLKNKVSQ